MEVSYNNATYNLPDFMIVGAAKSGTTSLYYNLQKSDNIFFPQVKEPHFFSFYGEDVKFKSPEKLPTVVSSLRKYSDMYLSSTPEQLLGDASPSYLYRYKETISNLYKIYGEMARDIKIVIVLRNPIDRAWSQYWHFRKNFNESESFDNAIKPEVISDRMQHNWNVFYNYIDFGMYSEQINAYKENFNSVKIFLYEDLREDTEGVVNQICRYLNTDTISIDKDRVYNPSGLPKNNIYGIAWRVNTRLKKLKKLKRIILPYKIRKKVSNYLLERSLIRQEMNSETREKLKAIYNDEIKQIHSIVQRDEVKIWGQ